MNHIMEGDPIFWDLGNFLFQYEFIKINPKYWATLKRYDEEPAYHLSETNMTEFNSFPKPDEECLGFWYEANRIMALEP